MNASMLLYVPTAFRHANPVTTTTTTTRVRVPNPETVEEGTTLLHKLLHGVPSELTGGLRCNFDVTV